MTLYMVNNKKNLKKKKKKKKNLLVFSANIWGMYINRTYSIFLWVYIWVFDIQNLLGYSASTWDMTLVNFERQILIDVDAI